MSDASGSAELVELLSQLNAQDTASPGCPPSPGDAMALYLVAARLVELQLDLADRGECADRELAVTKEVLRGTHRLLNAALDGSTAPVSRRPALRMVPGERPDRRRPRGRSALS